MSRVVAQGAGNGRGRICTTVRPFVDTNVWVYAHDSDEPSKRLMALDLLSGLSGSLTISTQVLCEFYAAVTRKLARPVPAEVAEAQVAEMAKLETVNTDVVLVKTAIALSRSSQISFWDALIVSAAAKGGCDTLFSEDLSGGQVIDGITIRNPFAGPEVGVQTQW